MRPFTSIRAALGPGTGSAYECKSCEETFDVQYHVCPACDGFSVEAVEGHWEGVDRRAQVEVAAVRGRR
ncbi:hypothetical protein ACFO0N_00385 [Halobium salinum]|uniref:Hydrogenase maturation nickel metallochaperone HypA n=1 Tax=Halobium salinum TaxID=1364940 RepID=A0ABD5P6B7_9EURY|nr:hypothetical protein [Halobium salinum]